MAIRADEVSLVAVSPPAGVVDLAHDRVLVERYQAGDQTAFDELYRRYFTRLRAFCRRRVGDAHEAEELAQEAFVRALQALPRLADERRFYPWVTVIASRLCVDHHRRLARTEPSDVVDLGTVDVEPGAALFREADLANLDRALSRLGPRHREVLDLRERREMSYAQIAEHLGVPQTTVEALLHRARKALRREFGAVTGHGSLAGVPVAGWLARRLHDLRARLGDRFGDLGQLVTPVAAGVVAATVALVPAGMPAGGGGPGPTAVTAVSASTTAPADVDGPAPTPVTPSATGAAAAPAEAPPAAPTGPTPPHDRPAVIDGGGAAVFVGSDAPARRADDMPNRPVDQADVVVGFDPAPVVDRLLPATHLVEGTP